MSRGGKETTLNTASSHDVNIVQDQSLNFKFSPTPHWDVNLDAQYVKAKHDNMDFGIRGRPMCDQELDLTGDYPVDHSANRLARTRPGRAPALFPSARRTPTDTQYFTDPRYTFWRSAMDHIEHSSGHEWAFEGRCRL